MGTLPLKPPVRARRVPALRRHAEHVVLTPQAIEELFRAADVLTEGSLAEDAELPTWYGSIMFTFHLDRLLERCRGLDQAEALDRLVDAVVGLVRVRIRAHRMACARVYERYPDRHVGTAHIETRFSRTGQRLLMDVDLEVPVEVASTHRRAR